MEDCVLACPNFWTDAQRRAMQDAARLAGLNPVRIMSETTACALNYGLLRPLPKDPIRVLFVDMGLTCTQVALIEFETDSLKVLGQDSDRHLGAVHFDNSLADHLAAQILDTKKMDVKTNAKALLRLRKECRKVPVCACMFCMMLRSSKFGLVLTHSKLNLPLTRSFVSLRSSMCCPPT